MTASHCLPPTAPMPLVVALNVARYTLASLFMAKSSHFQAALVVLALLHVQEVFNRLVPLPTKPSAFQHLPALTSSHTLAATPNQAMAEPCGIRRQEIPQA